MEITLQKLLEGQATIIKDKEFLPTKEYVCDFINEMSKFTKEFIINVQEPTQTILTENTQCTTYNKVWIQAIMPKKHNDLKEIYHFVYALDTKTPIYKIFRSYESCVFDTNWLITDKISGDVVPKYSLKNLMQLPNNIDIIINKMKNIFISPDEQHELFGKLMEKSMMYEYNNSSGKTKLSPSLVVKAYENVYLNSSSNFYVGNTKESSIWNFFNSFTDILKDDKKDINFFEKNHLVYLLFKDVIENGSN